MKYKYYSKINRNYFHKGKFIKLKEHKEVTEEVFNILSGSKDDLFLIVPIEENKEDEPIELIEEKEEKKPIKKAKKKTNSSKS
jgi:DNA-directed RNA polymerase sigma subunit (sigma70/sigma32)